MNNVKKEIYDLLSTLEYTVYQSRPEVLVEFPCVTFMVAQHSIEPTLEREIGYQQILFNVDLFADTASETSSMLAEVENLLRSNDYIMTDCFDLVEPDGRSHLALRFTYLS